MRRLAVAPGLQHASRVIWSVRCLVRLLRGHSLSLPPVRVNLTTDLVCFDVCDQFRVRVLWQYILVAFGKVIVSAEPYFFVGVFAPGGISQKA